MKTFGYHNILVIYLRIFRTHLLAIFQNITTIEVRQTLNSAYYKFLNDHILHARIPANNKGNILPI